MAKPQHIDSYYAVSVGTPPEFPQLNGNVRTEACVIGAGVSGISAALHLAERGQKVALLESNRPGWACSGRNGGHMETLFLHDPDDLNKMVGTEAASRIWELSSEAAVIVPELVARHRFDCDMKRGIGFAALTPKHAEKLYRGADKFRKFHGRNTVSYSRAELGDLISTERYHGGVFDMDLVHLNPLQLSVGLVNAAAKAGVQVYESTPALNYEQGRTVTIRTPSGRVEADYCVLACNANIRHLNGKLAQYLIPFTAWMIATQSMGQQRASALIKNDLAVNDTRTFIDFFRISGDHRLVFGAVSPMRVNGQSEIKSVLRKRVLDIYPQLHDLDIDYGWECTGALSAKNVPHMGSIAPNVYFLQGANVAWSILAGKLVSEAIAGRRERFDVMAQVKTPAFPVGHGLRVVMGNAAKVAERLMLAGK